MTQSNPKLDPKLELAISLSDNEKALQTELMVGYLKQTRSWRLIIKYNGDINSIAQKYAADVEVLTESYAIVTIKENLIRTFVNEKEIEYIEKPRRLNDQLETGIREACISQVHVYDGLTGEGVLVGIIDSGIDYDHVDFLDENGKSRILFIWDQSLDGAPPQGFIVGTEFTSDQINAAIATGNVDESHTLVPHMDINGHGTHVTGIAAGNGINPDTGQLDRTTGVASKSPLIIVKLGEPDFEGYPSNTVDIMLGVKYLVNKAEELNMPIAINISHGTPEGAHDGRSVFETYIDEMALRWKSAFVVAMGNEGNNGRHASGNTKDGNDVEFQINEGLDSVSIDIWKSQIDEYNLELISPQGTSTGVIPFNSAKLTYNIGRERVYILFNQSSPFSIMENISIEIISATNKLDEGIWTIRFEDRNVVIGDYQIWLSTNQPRSGCYFLLPTIDNTLTIPATCHNVISVGGYNPISGNISPFSGRGIELNVTLLKPDLVAPAEGISSASPTGGYEVLSGTSMAAPFVTGSCALLMEWGIVQGNDPYLYGQNLKGVLCMGARRDRSITYPNTTWGYGKLCLKESLDIVRSFSRGGFMRLESAAETEQKIASEDYIDIVVDYNLTLIRLALEDPDIIIGYVIYNLAIVYIKRSKLNGILNQITIVSNSSYPLLFGLLDSEANDAANVIPIIQNPQFDLGGRGVLIGIVDTGIDYTHPAFIYEDGTSKIQAIWDQTVLTGDPPSKYKFGTEYTKEDIDKALQAENPLDVVPSTDEIGHGTFIAGLACGRERGRLVGVARDAEIISVKLTPAKEYARENGMIFDADKIAYQDNDLIQGLYYLVDKARSLDRPLSILVALGTNQGSHDGYTYFNLTGSYRNTVLTIAAGNEGNARKHMQGTLAKKGDSKDIEINIADGETGLCIYIWGKKPDKFSVGITSPSGERIEKVNVRNQAQAQFDLVFYATVIAVTYYVAVDRNGDELCIIRLKNPEPGIWTIRLYSEEVVDGTFQAWLTNSDWSKPDTFFLQSSPDCTITELANSAQFITVGAYNHRNGNTYIRSSRGPSRNDVLKPDLIAPGVEIIGPAPGGGTSVQSGTSCAAAITAGAVALLLQWGVVNGNYQGMNTQIVKSILISGASRDDAVIYPNSVVGYGKLDLYNSFKEMNTYTNMSNIKNSFYYENSKNPISTAARNEDKLSFEMLMDYFRQYWI